MLGWKTLDFGFRFLGGILVPRCWTRQRPCLWLLPFSSARAIELAQEADAGPTVAGKTAMLCSKQLGTEISPFAATPRHSIERAIRNFARGALGASARDKMGSGHAVNAGPRKHNRALAAHVWNNLPGLRQIQKDLTHRRSF